MDSPHKVFLIVRVQPVLVFRATGHGHEWNQVFLSWMGYACRRGLFPIFQARIALFAAKLRYCLIQPCVEFFGRLCGMPVEQAEVMVAQPAPARPAAVAQPAPANVIDAASSGPIETADDYDDIPF